jgi:hypothetical protein
MIKICLFSGIGAAIVIACVATSPSMSDNAVLTSPFQPHVDIKTFMEHVLNPDATVIWRCKHLSSTKSIARFDFTCWPD